MALGIVKKSAEALANVMGPLLEGSLPHHLITSPLCAEATRVVPYREARDQVRALDFGSIEEFRMWQSDNPGHDQRRRPLCLQRVSNYLRHVEALVFLQVAPAAELAEGYGGDSLAYKDGRGRQRD